MSELRWILIGFGIALLACIYLWGRRSGRTERVGEGPAPSRAEPGLEAQPLYDDEQELDDASAVADGRSALQVDPYMATAVRPATQIRRAPEAPGAAPPSLHSATAAIEGVEEGSPGAVLDHGEARQTAPSRRGRVEPTLDDTATEDLPPPAQKDQGADQGADRRVDPPGRHASVRVAAQEPSPAPTLSSSESPQPRRIERRKILSLRLSTLPQQVDGAKLLETLQEEGLEHGKYNVFHRLHDDGVSIFSIASMVEPGTFDPETMPEIEYPGVTLFAQLPGPVPGMHALNELVACARRLQQALGGTLQDDRGVPLTVHRIERLRQEIREFERPASAGGRSAVMPNPPG